MKQAHRLAFISVAASLLAASPAAFAQFNGPSGFTYEGRVFDLSNNPSQATVSFILRLHGNSGGGDCVIYKETIGPKDLSLTNGRFSVTFGEGTRSAPNAAAQHRTLFSNKSTITGVLLSDGVTPCSFTPADGQSRKLQISIHDGSTETAMSPDLVLGSSPYAMVADTVQGLGPSDFLKTNTDVTQAKANSLMSSTNWPELLALLGGTSTQYAKPNQLNGVNLPALTSGQSLSWTGSSWSAVSPIMTEADPTVQAFAKTTLPTCGVGQVLESDGTSFTCVADSTGASGDATTSSKGVVQIGTGLAVSAGVISLPNVGSAGSYAKVVTDAQGRVSSGSALGENDIPALSGTWTGSVDGSKITGTIGGTTGINSSGNIITSGTMSSLLSVSKQIKIYDSDSSNYTYLQTPAAGTLTSNTTIVLPPYSMTFPVTAGSSGQVLSTDGAGNLSWATASGGGVTAVSATAPLTSSGGTSPVISLPQANAVTDGYISASDWSTFNNKLSTVVGAPLTAGQIWIGGGTNQAAAAMPSGDVSLTSGGVFTVLKMQGRPVSSTTPIMGQVLKYGSSQWEPANFSIADLKKADGSAQFATATCSAGQTLTWSSLTDSMTCTNISITTSQISDFPTALWQMASTNLYFNSGNVGIGTSSPAFKLEVPSSVAFGNWSSATQVLVRGDTSGAMLNLNRPVAPSGSEFVGKLAFSSDSFVTAGVFAEATESHAAGARGTALRFETTPNGSSSSQARLVITSEGDVAIGTSAPGALLHVGSSGVTAGATVAKFQSATGTCSLTPNTGLACSSDERLKENIRSVSAEFALDRLSQLQAVTYNMKAEPGKRQTGFIAQQVQRVAPEFVRQDEDGTLQVFYGGFIPWITESIKALHAKVQAQDVSRKSELAELKEENAMLKARIEAIERALAERK